MIGFKNIIPVLALLAPFVAAQASELDLEAIEAHFKQSGLEPDLIQDFGPDALLNFAYGGNQVQPGTAIPQADVGSAPTLTVIGSNGDDFNSSATYTIALVDADVVGKDQSAGQTRHWLVNGATLGGSGPEYTVNYAGTTITDYAGPGPAEGSGAHRYVLLLIEQPADFSPPADLSAAGTPLGVFNIEQYIEQSNLGDIAAANYFTVENGVATSSAPATSTVNTATLSSASASASGMSSSMSSMTSGAAASASSVSGNVASSARGAASSASSAAATPSGAASTLTPAGLNMGVIFSLVGVAVVTVGAGLGL